MQARWDEFGIDAFEFSILHTVPVENLLGIERRYVVSGEFAFNAIVPRRNPMKGRKHSPESLAKMSANRKGKGGQKGRVFSAEHRAAISAARKGKPGSPRGEVWRAHLSESQKRRDPASFARGPAHYNFGRKASPERLAQMSEAARRQNPETRPRGPSHPNFGKPARNKGMPGPSGADSARAIPVAIDGIAFPTITAAAKHFGICNATLYYRIKRGHHVRTFLEKIT